MWVPESGPWAFMPPLNIPQSIYECFVPLLILNQFLCLSSPVKLQLQATSVGEVVIKGVCANRYLAMNRDGRLFGAVSELDFQVSINIKS